MTGVPSRRPILSALGLTPAAALLLAVASMLALGGCGDSPPSRFYTLAARPAAGPAAKAARTIIVQRVEVAKYLDRPQIVRYGSPYELSFSEFDRWGEGLGDMVTRVLVADLAERLPGSHVYAATSQLSLPSADATLEVNIVRFEPDAAGTVILAAQWVIHRKGRGDRFRTQEFRVAAASGGTKTESTTTVDPTSQVSAMSNALGQLASEIAKGLAG